MEFWKTLFNLRRGQDKKENVLKAVTANVSFRGATLWILACAIVIASVGLNVNSTSVIIGAMLISPLMGPIVGAGFALGMFDFPLLKRSLKNLLVATVVGLLVSALYFMFTPFKDAQSEILSRTSPNIYDVMIAFFGGLVGVITVTRVEKGNPIPGVAIATALMPPLCTAGYGIATGNWKFAAGALFLYAINCTFICIATFIIVKGLDYPRAEIDEHRRKRIHWMISGLVVLIITPSIYFAYVFYKEQQFEKNVASFIGKEFEANGNTVVYKKTKFSSSPKTIELAFLIRKFGDDEIKALNSKLSSYGLSDTRLLIRQDSTYLADNRKQMQAENEKQQDEQLAIRLLQTELNNYRIATAHLFPEAKAIFPTLQSISIAKMQILDSTGASRILPVAIYSLNEKGPAPNEIQMVQWLKARLDLDTIQLYRH